MSKRSIWLQLISMVALLVAALLAAWQAVTLAWLSALPEWAAQLDMLRSKFWTYAVIGAVALMVCAGMLVRLVRQINRATARDNRKLGTGLG